MLAFLRLRHFRSYEDSYFSFEPGVNIILGPNTSGKTNLLEAVLVLAAGHSYRASDEDLIRSGHDWARLDGQNESGQKRSLKLDNRGPRLIKTINNDGKITNRFNAAIRWPVVLFEPNDLMLLSGPAERRRNYLDQILSFTSPGYDQLLRRYKRTLSQRNALLKQGADVARGHIFAWNIRLSELGGHIAGARVLLTTAMNRRIGQTYEHLSRSATKLEIEYVSRLPLSNYATALLAKLDANLDKDCLRGFTTDGPHRDDLNVSFNGRTSALVSSRGENRSALLALKSLELELLEEASGQPPLLLLDDVFSELDSNRRQALTGFLSGRQTIITTATENVVQDFGRQSNVISLGDG